MAVSGVTAVTDALRVTAQPPATTFEALPTVRIPISSMRMFTCLHRLSVANVTLRVYEILTPVACMDPE